MLLLLLCLLFKNNLKDHWVCVSFYSRLSQCAGSTLEQSIESMVQIGIQRIWRVGRSCCAHYLAIIQYFPLIIWYGDKILFIYVFIFIGSSGGVWSLIPKYFSLFFHLRKKKGVGAYWCFIIWFFHVFLKRFWSQSLV